MSAQIDIPEGPPTLEAVFFENLKFTFVLSKPTELQLDFDISEVYAEYLALGGTCSVVKFKERLLAIRPDIQEALDENS